MHRVRFVGSYGEVCERLSEAVRVLGAHTPAGRKRLTIEPIGPGPLAAAAWADDAPDLDSALLVLEAPPPAPDRTRFLRLLADVHRAASNMAVVVVLPCADRELALAAGALGVREVVLFDDEGTPAALAARLKRAMADPSILDFLEALPRPVPPDLRLLLARRLEELEGGVDRSPEDLAQSSGRAPRKVRSDLRALDLDPLETWCERAQLYAALRRSEEEGVPARRAALQVGFADVGALDEECLRETGREADAWLAAREGWSGALRAMAARWKRRAPRPRTQMERDASPAPQPEAKAFVQLLRATEDTALRIAEARLDGDEAVDVVEEVYEAIFRRGAEAWPRMTKSYVATAVRRRVANRLRDDGRRPQRVPLHMASVAATDRTADDALQDGQVEDAVRVALGTLHPRRALAWWLVDWRGWRPADAAALLGCSGPALRNLRTRAREELEARLRRFREGLG